MSDGTGSVLDTTLLPGSLNSNKSAGSDTGSSNGSCGDASPPETPTLSTTTNVPGLRPGSETQIQKHQQLGYNKPTGNTRLNGRSDKLISANVVVNSVSTAGSGMYTTPILNTHAALTQQPQPMYGTEIILTSGGNAGGIGLMQTSMANNNNCGIGNNIAVVNTTSNIGTSNNNLATNPVLMSSPSPGVAGGGGGSIITNMTPNPLILPTPHQQQYNATYPYHAAPTAQHQRLMSHTGGPAPPAMRLMPNEHIYSYYPIPGGAPPGAPPVALRPTNALPPNTNVTSGVTAVLQVQQQQPTAQALQPNPTIVASPTILAGTPYSTQAAPIASNKHLSCYNCGSQSHSGPDCQEASMEDVTRSAIYKLDYSGSSSASPTVSTGVNSVAVGSAGTGSVGGAGGVGSGSTSGGVITDSLQIQHHPQQQQQQQHHQKQHTVEVTGSTLVGTQTTATTLHSSTPAVSAVNTK